MHSEGCVEAGFSKQAPQSLSREAECGGDARARPAGPVGELCGGSTGIGAKSAVARGENGKRVEGELQ